MKESTRGGRREIRAPRTVALLIGCFLPFAGLASFAETVGQDPAGLIAMVKAERAFSAAAQERGRRQAFFDFFAEEGIAFGTAPFKLRERQRSHPVSAEEQRRPATFNWEPTYGDISAAEDLGYLTGPVWPIVLAAPPSETQPIGFYFSVWKRQAGGNYLVQLDMGIGIPGAAAHGGRGGFERSTFGPSKVVRMDAATARAEVLGAEASFRDVALKWGTPRAYSQDLAEESRLHHDGVLPVLGRAEIGRFIESRNLVIVAWDAIAAETSDSRDLGYTYGKFEWRTPEDPAATAGYFTRVWKRDLEGRWRLVAEVAVPNASPE